jgi:hypothetical protein
VARCTLLATSLAGLLVALPALAVLTPRAARADDQPEGTQPLAYSARPLTLPGLTLSPSASATLDKLSTTTATKIYTQNPKTLNLGVDIGASFGIVDNIEVGAVFAPLQVLPGFSYGNPSAHGTFRFVKSAFELAGYINTTFITHNAPNPDVVLPVLNQSAGVLLQPGLLSRIHMGSKAKLDIGATVPIQLGSAVHDVGLDVPVELAINLIDAFHIGAQSGFGIQNVKSPALDSYIPLGLITGFAIGSDKGPTVDIDALFRFPQFVNPGQSEKIDATDFQAGLSVAVYLYFM